MYIAILGRQPALGMAELEHLYGSEKTSWFSDLSVCVSTDSLTVDNLGGVQKAGKIVAELPHGDWRRVSMKIVQDYAQTWSKVDTKITLGISAYGFDIPVRDIQKTGIILKQKLKKNSGSLRLIPNTEPALNSATSHHNKLGLSPNKIEIIVIRARNGRIIIAESTGSQNITAYTKRDQERPKRDAFVGMLPPKLAQLMLNLSIPHSENDTHHNRVLDPFCGTGVVLQEAALMGYSVYGTDLFPKMIDFTSTNLKWLSETHHIVINSALHQADAMDASWEAPIDAVVCESYLGQPFSAPPSPGKLDQVRKNCNHIISTFLKNISTQIKPNTPLCIAVPAWRDMNNTFHHLPLVNDIETLGFRFYGFKHIKPEDLLYRREEQIVARELLVIVKT